MRRLCAVLLALAPLTAFAQSRPDTGTPLSAQAFEAHVTGHTVTYTQSGMVFGIEEYLTGRKVRWSVAPNQCQYGSWYPQDDSICFVYEYDPVPHCWRFWMDGGALVALSDDADPGPQLHETARTQTPLPCPGPDVGA